MVLADELTHFGYEKEGLEGVLNSAQVSQVLSIVDPERVQVGYDAAKAKEVDKGQQNENQGQDNNRDRSTQVLADLLQKATSHHDFHLGRAFLGILVIGIDDLIVPDDEGRLFVVLGLNVHDCGVDVD